MVVKMLNIVFWDETSCSLLGDYQHFKETLVTIYKSIQPHNPEDQKQQLTQRMTDK